MEQADFAQVIEHSTAPHLRSRIFKTGAWTVLVGSLILAAALVWPWWTTRGPRTSLVLGALLFGVGLAGRIKTDRRGR